METVVSVAGPFRISTGLIVERAWRDALGSSFFIRRLIFSTFLFLFSFSTTATTILSVSLSLFLFFSLFCLPCPSLSVVIQSTPRFYLFFPFTIVVRFRRAWDLRHSISFFSARNFEPRNLHRAQPSRPPRAFPLSVFVSRVCNTPSVLRR